MMDEQSNTELEASSPSRDVVVLCWDGPCIADRRAQKIAMYMGAKVELVDLSTATLSGGASIQKHIPPCSCLIARAETIARIAKAMPCGVGGLYGLKDLAENILIYGFLPTNIHRTLLQMLSSGRLRSVEPLRTGDDQFEVMEGSRQWCGQFSGLAVGTSESNGDSYFVEDHEELRASVMIRVGGRPFLVREDDEGSRIFFLASSELADLDEDVPSDASPLDWFSRLMPLMMFLRGSLKDRLWHNDRPRACFIIDDPLLKPRHGCLEYPRLLKSMREHGFSGCIAFIPWNYRRSSRMVTDLFASGDSALSLCVHGCDHTQAEFADADPLVLQGKAQLALERMRAHRKLSGLAFDDVMVFPQGLFSAEAMAALKAAGYVAAINSDLCPYRGTGTLTLRDLLDVAVTRFSNFPLFGRRYPRRIAEFAFDLFMGKPALAVEHHGYFRDGHRMLEAFIDELNGLDERLEWQNLGSICSQTCLAKVNQNGEIHLRFYTSRFQLENTGTKTQKYILIPCQTADALPSGVTVDGHEWHSEQEQGQWRIRLSLDAGQVANIRLFADKVECLSWKGSRIYNLRVRMRRLVCEFRDNYVDTNQALERLAYRVRTSLRTKEQLAAL